MNRMIERYQNEAVPALKKAFSYKNVMQVPRIAKVVVNIGVGEALDNKKALEFAVADLTTITGPRPVRASPTSSCGKALSLAQR
jgi:large subunit ribosomal protein L5